MLRATLFYGFEGAIDTQTAVTDSIDRPKGAFTNLASYDVVVIEIAHPSHHEIFATDAQLALELRISGCPLFALPFCLYLNRGCSFGFAAVLAC